MAAYTIGTKQVVLQRERLILHLLPIKSAPTIAKQILVSDRDNTLSLLVVIQKQIPAFKIH